MLHVVHAVLRCSHGRDSIAVGAVRDVTRMSLSSRHHPCLIRIITVARIRVIILIFRDGLGIEGF